MPPQSTAPSPKPVATGTTTPTPPAQTAAALSVDPKPTTSATPAPDLPKIDIGPSTSALSSRNFWVVAFISSVMIFGMAATVAWLYITIFGSPG